MILITIVKFILNIVISTDERPWQKYLLLSVRSGLDGFTCTSFDSFL